MLGIQKLASLADIVGFDLGELKLAAEFADRDVTKRMVWHINKKPRPVISVSGSLRRFQDKFYRRVLKHRLHPSAYSFGGVPGQHPLSNASQHLGHNYVYKTDISNFFPSITIDRVNRLFVRCLHCSYEVSRILTRLCTFDYHLSLGLVTSPVLADQILQIVDKRIAALCAAYQLTYTRFVDDIAISGQFNILNSPVPSQIRRILKEHGFREKSAKSCGGRLDKGETITGLRLKGNRIDVAKDYVDELERQIMDHHSLACGGEFNGPLCSSSQLYGRVNYVCWVNPGRRFGLRRKLRSIRWFDVWDAAEARGLVIATPKITDRNESAPSFERSFGGYHDSSHCEKLKEIATLDDGSCPF